MSRLYYPQGDPDYPGISSYSPLAGYLCAQRPFGDLAAEDYLHFARLDHTQGDERGYVNALGNAKRSFHYQIDRLIYRFGLRHATEKLDFPEKVELLREMRVIQGALLKQFNKQRNVMEHDYVSPSADAVEAAIDLCELLLLATERFLTEAAAAVRVVLDGDTRDLILHLDTPHERIRKYLIRGSTPEVSEYGVSYRESLYERNPWEDLTARLTLSNGLTIEPLPSEDVMIGRSNRADWLPVMRMLVSTAHRFIWGKGQPDKPMISITQWITEDAWAQFIREARLGERIKALATDTEAS